MSVPLSQLASLDVLYISNLGYLCLCGADPKGSWSVVSYTQRVCARQTSVLVPGTLT